MEDLKGIDTKKQWEIFSQENLTYDFFGLQREKQKKIQRNKQWLVDFVGQKPTYSLFCLLESQVRLQMKLKSSMCDNVSMIFLKKTPKYAEV